MMQNNLERKFRQISKLEGYLIGEEGKLLFSLAKNCPKGLTIVEIGSWKGKSTAYLALGSMLGNKNKIYAIDPHTGSKEHKQKYGKVWTYQEFRKNLEKLKLSKYVNCITKTSAQSAPNFHKKIGLIFIDGDHSYQSVKKDFDLWYPKLTSGGIIAFHDSTGAYPGVKKVVEKYIYKSRFFRKIHLFESITYAQKVDNNTLSDRLRNRYVLLLKNIFENCRKLKPPEIVVIAGKFFLSKIQ